MTSLSNRSASRSTPASSNGCGPCTSRAPQPGFVISTGRSAMGRRRRSSSAIRSLKLPIDSTFKGLTLLGRSSKQLLPMNAKKILEELKAMGSEGVKKIFLNHGIKEPLFGVKGGDMKKIQKRIKKDHQLALELYDTGNYDAMYLAALIADDAKMTRKDLAHWVEKANCGPLAAVPGPGGPGGSPH